MNWMVICCLTKADSSSSSSSTTATTSSWTCGFCACLRDNSNTAILDQLLICLFVSMDERILVKGQETISLPSPFPSIVDNNIGAMGAAAKLFRYRQEHGFLCFKLPSNLPKSPLSIQITTNHPALFRCYRPIQVQWCTLKLS